MNIGTKAWLRQQLPGFSNNACAGTLLLIGNVAKRTAGRFVWPKNLGLRKLKKPFFGLANSPGKPMRHGWSDVRRGICCFPAVKCNCSGRGQVEKLYEYKVDHCGWTLVGW